MSADDRAQGGEAGARRPLIAICSVEPNAYTAPFLAELCGSAALRVAAVHFSKSFQADRGIVKSARRLLGYGTFNLARIAQQRLARRRELRFDEQARVARAEAALAACAAQVFRGTDFAGSLRAFLKLSVDGVVLVYFNRIVPGWFLAQLPRVYNIHPGRLPEFRGVQPVFWTLQQRERNATITLHVAEAAIDAGPVVLEASAVITRLTYHDTLLALSDLFAPQTPGAVCAALQNEIALRVQEESAARYFGRPAASDLRRFLQSGLRYY